MSAVASLTRRDDSRDSHGLTQRELEVLRLVAAGKSNRQIARHSSSASTPSPATCRTSWPSSVSRRVQRRPRSRSSTNSSDEAVVNFDHGRCHS